MSFSSSPSSSIASSSASPLKPKKVPKKWAPCHRPHVSFYPRRLAVVKQKRLKPNERDPGTPIVDEVAGPKFVCITRRVRVDASSRVYEGEEKKAGKLVYFKRNVFVPPYDYLEMRLYDPDTKRLYLGKLLYSLHNVDRKRKLTDDTWDEATFLNTIQEILQVCYNSPDYFFSFFFDSDVSTKLKLEIREVKKGVTKRINTAAELDLVSDNAAVKNFLDEVSDLQWTLFERYCRGGKLAKAKQLLEHGFIDVHKFRDGRGWNVLQSTCFSGKLKVAIWLLDECKVDPLVQSIEDGWTALHCACAKGHFEIAKLLALRGCKLTARSRHAYETPITLMQRGKYSSMMSYFLNEDSVFAKELYKKQGTRPSWKSHPVPGMFNLIKPFHTVNPKVKGLKELKKVFKKCEELNL